MSYLGVQYRFQIQMRSMEEFMEGNGRSARVWMDLILKKQLKQCVDWSKIGKNEYMDAMVKSPANSSSLKTLLLKA